MLLVSSSNKFSFLATSLLHELPSPKSSAIQSIFELENARASLSGDKDGSLKESSIGEWKPGTVEMEVLVVNGMLGNGTVSGDFVMASGMHALSSSRKDFSKEA